MQNRVHKTAIQDTSIIEWDLWQDKRGFVGNIWTDNINNKLYQIIQDKSNYNVRFIEDRISISKKNVFRGLHGDSKTWKLITVFNGDVWLILVDARKKSPTYKELVYLNFKRGNNFSVLVPPGVLNGHLCLSEECVLFYKWSEYYDGPNSQVTVNWNDPAISISLGCPNPIISERDKSGTPFEELNL